MDGSLHSLDFRYYPRWNEGKRIVDLGVLAEQLVCRHCNCFLDLRRIEREERYGLASVLYITCICGLTSPVHTQKQVENNMLHPPSGWKAALDMLVYGDGRQFIVNFLATLNVPLPPGYDLDLRNPPPPMPGSGTGYHPATQATSSASSHPQSSGSTEKTVYNCPVCGKNFPTSKGFGIHMSRMHQDTEVMGNMVIEPGGSGSSDRYDHSFIEEMERRPGQGEVVTNTSNLMEDIPDTKYKYKCPTCERVVPTARGFVIHMSRKHQITDVQAPDYAFEAPKEPASTEKLDESANTTTGSQDTSTASDDKGQEDGGGKATKVLHCRACPETFTSQSSLMSHRKEAHPRGDVEITCSYCSEVLKNAFQLKKHIRAVHPKGMKRTFTCEVCAKQFTHMCLLKAHARQHTGERPYACFYCDKKFLFASHRADHVKRIHTKVRKHLCETCGSSFYTPRDLRIHERMHTGERPLKCRVCSRTFARETTLVLHERLHSGERPYQCQKCGSAFVQYISLRNHYRSHHPELSNVKISMVTSKRPKNKPRA